MNLEDILRDDDELACLDKIYMRLEEINKEDEDFMQLLVAQFHNTPVTWEQPWYQEITSCLTRPLNNDENQNAFRTDTISKEEEVLIKKNWIKLTKKYDIPDKLHCLARWKNKGKCRNPNTPEECARRFVIAYLSQGLNRTLHKVYKYIITHYEGFVKGPYSPEEEKVMEICFRHNPGSAVTMLSKVLKREPRGIYKRLQQMFEGKPVKKRVKWTLSMASKFFKLLLKYSGLPVEQLKNKKIAKEVWLKLQKKFDHHYIHLEGFWNTSLHMQIFVKEKISRSKLRRMVFKKLRVSNYQVWSDIRWKDIAKEFPDCYTHRFLYLLTYKTFSSPRINLKTKSLQENIDFALNKLKTSKHFRRKHLRTLALNSNGELEVVRYDRKTIEDQQIDEDHQLN